MKIQLNHRQQKFLFLIGITAIYSALVVWLDFLQAPPIWDENHFWETSLTFSDKLIPSIDDLRNYGQLSTPLPFIIFGSLEYLFHQGIFAGRLFSLILSLSIVFIIGWPTRNKGGRAILSLIGLLWCPYFLWYGVLLYTDIIACFFVLIGFVSYIRNRHLISSIAFILAIASRQYMLAFPMAIATYELIIAIKNIKSVGKINLVQHWRWIAPLIAALSIFGWIYLFGGLAPKIGLEVSRTPSVQKTTWAFTFGGAINFLSFVGFYIVIPEFILFRPRVILKILKQRRRIILIAVGLLLCFSVFPPLLKGMGTVMKIAKFLPYDILKLALFYSLSLLTCLRFSQLNLMSLIVIFNSLIMIKAYPWDKYVLPIVVVFWYLKSLGIEDKFNIFKLRNVKT